jgi:hypothetical protein
METRSWAEVKNDLFGPEGSPERIELDLALAALERRDRIAHRLIDWLHAFGPVGHLAATFWFYVLREGSARSVRDGMEWTYLNDAMGKPRLWQVWDEMRGKRGMLYPGGAPAKRPENAWACDDCGMYDGLHDPDIEH